jgi:prepilin-type N-terminal cleavage/methylation domain-containing protein
MRTGNDSCRGYSLVELVLVILLLAIVSSLALPPLRHSLERARVRSALNQVVAELYMARMRAIQAGQPSRLVLSSNGSGCVESIRSVQPAVSSAQGESGVGATARTTAVFDLPGLCLRHSGDSILVFNSRGFLLPPARSLAVTYRGVADSVLIAVSGRVRRSYRRKKT